MTAAYVNRGSVNVALGKFDNAVTDYNTAIKLDANLAAVYQNRGVALLLIGRETEAAQDFAKCIELDSSLKSSLEEVIKRARRLRLSKV